MQSNHVDPTAPHLTASRLLIVADWTVDPDRVVAAARHRRKATELGLVVPARLHGLDWAGDPGASCPCAQRQLEAIERLAAAAGLRLALAQVGDPDTLAAIGDALKDWPAQELLVCERQRFVGMRHAFDLPSRARRQTGVPVERLVLPPARNGDGRRGLLPVRRGHCELPAQAA
jgi:hypothetical protein